MNRQSLFKNINWLLAEKLVRLALGLFVSVVTARYLGPENMGVWNYLLAIVSVFSMGSILGFDVIASKEFVNRPKEEGALLATIFSLRLMGGILAYVASLVFFYFTSNLIEIPLYLMAIIGTSIIFQSFDAADYYFQSKLKSQFVVLARFTAFITVVILKIYWIQSQTEFIWFVFSSVLEIIIAALVFVYLIFGKKLGPKKPYTIDKSLAKALLSNSWIYMLSAFLVMLGLRLDQFFITNWLGELSNGIYGTAIKMFEISNFIPHVISVSFIPFLANKKLDGRTYLDSFKKMSAVLIILSLLFTLVVWFWAEPIMLLLYGDAFLGSGEVLKWLSLSFLPVFLLVSLNSFLIVENLKKYFLIKSLIGLAVNVFFNLLLIPLMGVNGAALAYFAGLMSSTIYVFIVVSKIINKVAIK